MLTRVYRRLSMPVVKTAAHAMIGSTDASSKPSMSAIESLLGHFDAGTIQGLCVQLGARPPQVTVAIQASLPLLMGAMQRNVAEEGGTEALYAAVSGDHHDANLAGLFSAFLGRGAAAPSAPARSASAARSAPRISEAIKGSPIDGGMAILGHIFGKRRARAANGVALASGLNQAAAEKLLAMLAMLLMGAFGRAAKQRNLDARGVSSLLAHDLERISGERPGAVRQMLGNVLDRDAGIDANAKDALARGRELFGAFIRR